jgi:hypothetical protein
MSGMRGWRVAAVLAVLGLALAASPTGAGIMSKSASIRIVDRDPLVLRGQRFEPGERVRLLIVAARPFEKRVRAGEGGGFLARFRGISKDRCGALYVQAVGNRGSRAEAGLLRFNCSALDPRDGPPPADPGPILP